MLLVEELLRVLLTVYFVFNSDRHLALVVLGLFLLTDLVVFVFEVLNLIHVDLAFVLVSSPTPLSPALQLFLSLLIWFKLLVLWVFVVLKLFLLFFLHHFSHG